MQLQAELAVLLSRSYIVVLLFFSCLFFSSLHTPPHTYPFQSSTVLFFFISFGMFLSVSFTPWLPHSYVCMCVCIYYILPTPHTNTCFGGNRLKLIDCSRGGFSQFYVQFFQLPSMKKLIGTRSLTLTHSRALSLSHSLPPSILSLSLSLVLTLYVEAWHAFFKKQNQCPSNAML